MNSDLVSKCMNVSKDFFHLPKKVKDQYERDEKIQQGYVEPGREVFTDTTKEVIMTCPLFDCRNKYHSTTNVIKHVYVTTFFDRIHFSYDMAYAKTICICFQDRE